MLRWNCCSRYFVRNASATAAGPEKRSKYIILGAKSSRLLPKKRRQFNPQTVSKGTTEQLDDTRKELMVFKSELSDKAIIDSVNKMKPMTEIVSEKRRDQVASDLMKSFTNKQLINYIESQGFYTPKRPLKRDSISTIIKKIWNLGVSKDIDESSDVIVENSLNLSRRDLFLILANDGAIPREWTKSGAKIIVISEKRTIVIRSTQETYDWILASLHRKLDKIQSTLIRLDTLGENVPEFNVPINKIQRLSNAYLHYNAADNTITASSLRQESLDLAKRLIVQASRFAPFITNEYAEDTTNDLQPKCGYTRFIDNDSQEWMERGRTWARWQKAKRKMRPEEIMMQTLPQDEPQTREWVIDGRTVSVDEPHNQIAKQLERLALSGTSTAPTLTATFGYLLKDQDNNEKTFVTNVPGVFEQTWNLPYYNMDIDVEDEAQLKADISLTGDDAWQKVLDNVGTSQQQKVAKTSGLLDESSHMVQLRFVPSPFSDVEPEVLKTIPTLDMVLDLNKDNQADLDTCRMISVEQDSNLSIALPDKPTDIKFSVQRGAILDHKEPEIQSFLQSCTLDFSGSTGIHVPSELTLNINGKSIPYSYQGAYHRQQTERKYQGQLLVVSTIEGGGINGRRIEVQFAKEMEEQFDFDKASKFAETAFNFIKLL